MTLPSLSPLFLEQREVHELSYSSLKKVAVVLLLDVDLIFWAGRAHAKYMNIINEKYNQALNPKYCTQK